MTPHQTGELHILGIAYHLAGQVSSSTRDDLACVTSNDVGNRENPDSPQRHPKKPASVAGSGAGAAVAASVAATAGSQSGGMISVQGGQELDIQGPRLNGTKVERCSVVYGPDRRLDPVVVPPMPLLEVNPCMSLFVCFTVTLDLKPYMLGVPNGRFASSLLRLS